MNNEYWKITSMGHEPLFPIDCPRCGTPKRLRYSHIFRPNDVYEALQNPWVESHLSMQERHEILNKEGWAEDRAYKCPKCQHWEVFGIPMSWEEVQIVRQSGRKSLYIPLDQWEDDHPIRKKLAALGYW
jgi:transcription elongation factor Elf1